MLDSKDTIVKLCEGKGEPPLIMVHGRYFLLVPGDDVYSSSGGGGHIYDLIPMSSKFGGAFWAIQITPETPLESLVAQTDFYFSKIKVLDLFSFSYKYLFLIIFFL